MLARTWNRCAVLVGLVAVACSLYYWHSDAQSSRIALYTAHEVQETLTSLLRLQNEFRLQRPVCSGTRPIVVGFNGNLDMVVNAADLVQTLMSQNILNASDFNPQPQSKITTSAHLASNMALFISRGAATEKFCNNHTLFSQIVASARSVSSADITLGGNAAIMATRFAALGCSVKLASYMGPELKMHMNGTAELLTEKLATTSDDIHMIMEYSKGQFLPGKTPSVIESNRANRYILTREQNFVPIPADIVESALANYDENAIGAIVLSGFHLWDGQPSPQRDEQLRIISAMLDKWSSKSLTHIEIASMSEARLYVDLKEHVLSRSRSAGANEQEVAAFYDVLRSGKLDPSGYRTAPEVATSLEMMAYLVRATGLSRLHMHALPFHAICQRVDGGWPSPVHSVVESSLTASRQACQQEDMRAVYFDLLMPQRFGMAGSGSTEFAFDSSKPVTCRHLPVDESGVELECCVAPVLVCKSPRRTVGLGDHVSASGLSVYV